MLPAEGQPFRDMLHIHDNFLCLCCGWCMLRCSECIQVLLLLLLLGWMFVPARAIQSVGEREMFVMRLEEGFWQDLRRVGVPIPPGVWADMLGR